MISNEMLEQVAKLDVEFLTFPPNHAQVAEMARELLALRKAFSEPVAWVPLSQLNLLWKKKNVIVEADLSAVQRFDDVPLYRKPTLPE